MDWDTLLPPALLQQYVAAVTEFTRAVDAVTAGTASAQEAALPVVRATSSGQCAANDQNTSPPILENDWLVNVGDECRSGELQCDAGNLTLQRNTEFQPINMYSSTDSSCDESDHPGGGTVVAASVPRRAPPPSGRHGLPPCTWLFDRVTNRDVVTSIIRSMHRRFGSAGPVTHSMFAYTDEPANVLQPRHFDCESVIVQDSATASRCLDFVSREATLSVDTETAQPGRNQRIALIQIGTIDLVFLVQVCRVDDQFLRQLGRALVQKTLLHWGGGEVRDLQTVTRIRKDEATFVDVQVKYMASRRSKRPGLDWCMGQLLRNHYVLSKTWRLSGWDAPELHPAQVSYATLDVVAVHVLYAAKDNAAFTVRPGVGTDKLVFTGIR